MQQQNSSNNIYLTQRHQAPTPSSSRQLNTGTTKQRNDACEAEESRPRIVAGEAKERERKKKKQSQMKRIGEQNTGNETRETRMRDQREGKRENTWCHWCRAQPEGTCRMSPERFRKAHVACHQSAAERRMSRVAKLLCWLPPLQGR